MISNSIYYTYLLFTMATESFNNSINPMLKEWLDAPMQTESFKAHISEWVKAFSPDRSRKELIDKFMGLLWDYIGTNNLNYYDCYDPSDLVHIDRLLGFELDDGARPIEEYVRDYREMPTTGTYFEVDESRGYPSCLECGGKNERKWYLVVQKGFFTCKVERVPDWDLEATFATQMLARHGEEAMRRKFFSVFEPTFQMLAWLDNCILGRRTSPYWGNPTKQGWSGKYSRHLYTGDVGKLHRCNDRDNTYYIVRRAAVFTCDVEFFASKEEGEAAVAGIEADGAQ